MQNSQLVNVLHTFSKKDIRDCRKWLESPAHNLREDVLLLFDYLMEEGRLEDETALDKATVFPLIFPDEEYDDAKMRQVMHFLLKAVEEFLTYQELMTDDAQAHIALSRVYRKRKLNKLFKKNIRTLGKLQKKAPFRNREFFNKEYLIQQENYAYLSEFKRVELNLQEVSDTLDLTFLADKLRQSVFMLSHQTVYKNEYDIGLLDEVLAYLENKPKLLEIPAIAMYYFGYKALTNKQEEQYFNKLKSQLIENAHFFPHSEIRDIYLMAINYCIGRMNAGDSAFIREAFELYQPGYERKILIENEQVSRLTFLNSVTIALRLGEFEWAEQFIENYQHYLEERYRESFVRFSLARLNFERKNYDEAMRLLVQVEFDDILFNLNARTMLLKMYYEQDEFDALDSLLGSTNTYLQRKKVMGYHKSNYKNIIRFTKKLTRINPFEKTEREKLYKEIEAANPLTEKSWLLEQLQTMSN